MFARAKNRPAKRRVQAGATAALTLGGVALLCTVALTATGTANAPGSSTDRVSVKVYKMHRPGLRVRLQVEAGVIFPTRIWARTSCSNGFEGGSGLFLEEPTSSQEIFINHKGRFKYDFPARELREEALLAGRVYERKITGYYLEWDYEGGVLCGTGQPGDRAVRFVAGAG